MIWKAVLLAVLSLFPDIGYADGFPATRYPFTPKLTENKEPALCQIFLNQAKTLFRSTQPNPVLDELKHPEVTWVKWDLVDVAGPLEPTAQVYGKPEYLRADLDLEGNGRVKTVVQYIFWHSWRGQNHQSYVFGSPKAFMDAVKDAKTTGSELDASSVFAKGTQYYPTGATGSMEDADWNSHSLFQYKKRFYFPSLGTQADIGDGFSVIRLGGDGTSGTVCAIQMAPDQRVIQTFVDLPGISSYLKVMKAMGHAGGGGDCGTLHAEYNHDGGAEEAIRRSAFRPWAIGRHLGNNLVDPYYRYDSRLESFIKEWGYQDVWNYREYQTSRNHIQPALQAVARYFEQSFGMSQAAAAKESRRVYEEVTAAWFLVPRSWDTSKEFYGFNDSIGSTIVQGDAQKVKSFEEYLSTDDINSKRYLLDSAESLPITRLLLKVGADPNVTNRFGKTALMYAAHMNRPDVMEELLKHKADVNAATQSVNECDLRVERSERSALMYAAENAHPAAMALLVKWGADIKAKDSQGNDVQFYLSKNPLLTPSEREMTLVKLLDVYKEKPIMPSFNCEGATRGIDRLICGDSVLRMHDQAMGRAYQSWLELSKSPDSKADQVRWIKGRDQSCVSLADDAAVTCVQQWTRARVRYLHNRLEEIARQP